MAGVLDGHKIGFLGAGAMAEAMARGLLGRGAVLSASDPDPVRRKRLEEVAHVRATADNRSLTREADTVILAVKPQIAPAVLAEVGMLMRPGQVLLSIVAGLRLATIGAAVTAGVRLVRAMPNAPALIGAGITGVAPASPGAGDEELARAILEPLGRVVVVAEHLLDAVTGLSGSGPAYVALFVEALIEGGVKAGLPWSVARELANETLLGSARLLAGGEAPAALRERVTSPGGTTACGLYALERGGLRAAVIEAVTSAAERAAALGGTRETRSDLR